MKEERLVRQEENDFFSLKNGSDLAKKLSEMEESAFLNELNKILSHLEKLTFSRTVNTMGEETSVQIRPFLRVISKRIQVESKKAGAWRYYQYGRYDGQQEYLFEQLREKEKNIHTEEILARKNVAKIIKYLYTNGSSQQSKIAKDLQLDTGNFIKLMDLLQEEELVQKNKGVKFVFYDLTQRCKTICNRYYREVSYMEESDEKSALRLREEDYGNYRNLFFKLKKKDDLKQSRDEAVPEIAASDDRYLRYVQEEQNEFSKNQENTWAYTPRKKTMNANYSTFNKLQMKGE